MKRRNPIAKALRSPHLRVKVVRNKKAYTRKGRSPKGGPSSFLAFECQENP